VLGNKQNKKDRQSINSSFAKAGPYLNIGYFFMASMFVFGLIGHFVDTTYEYNNMFLLTGLFVGLIFGFYNMFKVISQIEKKSK
jgi:F0F1-type ATP synthase assembly protein I